MPLAQRPVIHAQRRRRVGRRHGCSPDQAQQVFRLVASPMLRPRRAPAAPPSARPTAVSRSDSRAVLQAQGAKTLGRRSVEMRRLHPALSQKSFQTWSWTATACSLQGRSAKARSYQLWVRLARRPQSGHGAARQREVRVRVIVGGAGSAPQVSSRTAGGSGNKQEIRSTHPMWRRRHDDQKRPRPRSMTCPCYRLMIDPYLAYDGITTVPNIV